MMKRWTLLVIMMLAVAVPFTAHAVENLLPNGDFEDSATDPAPWTVYGDAEIEVVSDEAISGNNSLYVKVNSVGANFWDAGLQNKSIVFQPGTYTLSAFLKGEAEREINFKPELAQDPWTGYGEQRITMTTEWKEYYTTAEIPALIDPASITFHIAFSDVNFWIDNVKWYEGAYVPSEIPTAVQPEGKLATAWAYLKIR